MRRNLSVGKRGVYCLRGAQLISALALVGVAILGAAPSIRAAYILVDDFESYTTGNSNAGQSNAFTANGGPWQPRAESANIAGSGLIQVQSDGSTKRLLFGWNAGTRSAYRAVTPINEGDSATYYFQVRTSDSTPDMSYGLSDQTTATAAQFGDFEVQVALVDDGNAGNNLFKLVGRDGGSLVDLATGLSINTWYDIWLVVNNSLDTYDVYFGTTGDPNVLGPAVADDLGFRNGLASNDLVTFMTLDPPGGGNPTDSSALLDDIWYNPDVVPEPATFVLALIVGLALVSRRRLIAA